MTEKERLSFCQAIIDAHYSLYPEHTEYREKIRALLGGLAPEAPVVSKPTRRLRP